MPTRVAVGINKGPGSLEAGRDAAFEAKVALQSDEVSLAICFSSINFNLADVLRGVKRVIKSAPLVGTTGAGVITAAGSQKRAVAVMLIASSNIKCGVSAVGPITGKAERASGRQLAAATSQQTKLFKRHAFTLFCDHLVNNPADFISGLQEVLGASFPITGGFSADDGHFAKTYQFYNEQVISYSATGVLWAGDCICATSTGHGWKPLGRPLTITASEANRIKTIENKPAIKLFEDYFGDNINDLKEMKLSKVGLLYPLGFYINKEDGYILRNVLSVEEDGSLVFQGNIPEDSQAHLMIGTKDSLILAAKDAAKLVNDQITKNSKQIRFAIVCESFSRYKLLGRSSDTEIEVIREELGPDVPIIGFYSFGEYAPLSALNFVGKSYILNESINILAIGE